jgi:zeaxanthin glucosyltransferase
MPQILIDILPFKGHFHSSLKLINLLRNAGYEVLYLNMDTMMAELKIHEFNSCASPFIVKHKFLRIRRFSIRLFFNNISEIFTGRSFQKFKNEFLSFKKFLAELSPDLVLLDEQNMLKSIYYELCNIPVITFETKPDPCKFNNTPPFTSFFIPTCTFLSNWICKWLWFKKIILNHYRLKKLQLNNLWTDHYSMTSRIAGEYGIDLKNRTDLERSFGIGIKGIPRIILSPAAFDFPHNGTKETYMVGPLIDIKRNGEYFNSNYSPLNVKIKKVRKNGKGSIIYCSLGTITLRFKKKVRRFFFKLLMVARQNPNDLFIFSTGKEFDISEISPMPDNIFVYQYLPQIDLLKNCDIMITHGGMNSITECIFCEVPVLVYPLSQEWDQPGNAARALYHGLGLKGSINRDSTKKISQKLEQLKSDHSFYKHNLRKMKAKFEEKNNSDEALRIIEMILNTQTETIKAEYELDLQK